MSHYGVVFSWILLFILLMLFSLKYRAFCFSKEVFFKVMIYGVGVMMWFIVFYELFQ